MLLFELLTGNPPFEGASQSELFDNISKLKIKWPKGFSGVAKDLISKLLKSEPSQRIKLDDITEHPWFKNNPPMRPVAPGIPVKKNTSNQLNIDGHSGNIAKADYQVVSQPSIVNKTQTQNKNGKNDPN